MNHIKRYIIVAAVLLMWVSTGFCASIIRDINDTDDTGPSTLVLPYFFYNDYFEGAFGIVFGANGYLQEQTRIFSTVLESTNTSFLFAFLANDIQLPVLKRVFINPQFSVGRFKYQRAYVNGNPLFPNDIAGSNDSHKDNYIETKGWDNFAEIEMKYLLPIGSGRDAIIHTYYLERGVLMAGATGGTTWNPMKSGLTSLVVTPFYRAQSFNYNPEDMEFNTNGVEISVEYDNTDFFQNPSMGSMQRLSLSRDFGALDSSDSWTVIEGDFSKYLSIGANETFRQRVVALNLWAADTPSWKESRVNGSTEITHRPPQYKGAVLGGFHRLRAYPSNRFNSRSALYATAEYRVIPEWHPLGDVAWLNRWLLWDWWQFTGFVEAGRVSDRWDIKELVSDMKWDAGLGLRGYMRKVLIRIEASWSDEGVGMTFWAGHPF